MAILPELRASGETQAGFTGQTGVCPARFHISVIYSGHYGRFSCPHKDGCTIKFSQYQRKIEALIELGESHLIARQLVEIDFRERRLPVHAIQLGGSDPALPAVAFIGGVHGLENIGIEVVLAFLETLLQRLQWDEGLPDYLGHVRLLFIPVVNPAGVVASTRANAHGVDLMRNAPVEAETAVPFLLGGHRISHRLPWFRGLPDQPMQAEARVLCDAIDAHFADSAFCLSLDCHSGFGLEDRIWFPYACRRQPITHLVETWALSQLLSRTYPHLNYVFEPQSRHYTTHGDLWDYLYDQRADSAVPFLPLTLEMGSWRWVKKNPLQLLHRHGMFNPVLPHRIKRILRRHLVFMNFLIHAARSHQNWRPRAAQRQLYDMAARKKWYEK